MKNRFLHLQSLVAVVLCTMMSMTFASCGDDDDDGAGGDKSIVVGHWVGNDYDTFYSNVSITFNYDGTGSATMERVGGYTSIYRGGFTYKVSGNKVTTKGTLANSNSNGETSSQDFNNTYEVQGNLLYVRDGNNWYTMNVKSYRKQ